MYIYEYILHQKIIKPLINKLNQTEISQVNVNKQRKINILLFSCSLEAI